MVHSGTKNKRQVTSATLQEGAAERFRAVDLLMHLKDKAPRSTKQSEIVRDKDCTSDSSL